MKSSLNPKAKLSLHDILGLAECKGSIEFCWKHSVYLRTTEKLLEMRIKRGSPFSCYLQMEFALPTMIFDVVC